MAPEDDIVRPDVASAGLHVSERIGHDVASTQLDLEESLEASRYASHPYAAHPKDWPAFVEVSELRELPSVLVERYHSVGEVTTLCGIFPEIHRTWASVDNSLFVWRYDKWDGQCKEHNEEQAILAVGLARAKPGVFVEAIQYLLILATPVELVLLGVCCASSGDGVDLYAELALQPLPDYRIPCDGAEAVCISSTESGRIFMAARDGQIYELIYTNGSGWQKRFRSVCMTSSLLMRFLPTSYIFGAADPIIQMVIDNERHILYARTEGTKLQVYDLGENGDGQLRKIAEEKNFIDPREANQRVRRAAGPRPSIACIAPLSLTESKRLNLVAVLSDGKRLYFFSFGLNSTNAQRPTCLKVIATRPPPPPVPGRAHQPDNLALKADAAFYSVGTLILSDSSGSAGSSLITVQRDSSQSTTPPAGATLYSTSGSGAARNSRVLREVVSTSVTNGWVLCAADVLPSGNNASIVQSLYRDVIPLKGLGSDLLGARAILGLWARGDLSTQHILPRRRFVIFSNMGLAEVTCNRPVDMLSRLFDKNAPRLQIEEFFNRYGPGEAAAMCLILASQLLFDEELTISSTVRARAAEAFDDPGLVGTTQVGTGSRPPSTANGAFSMGQVVVQEAGPAFSGAYEGLCLCASRLLLPVWEFPVVMVRGHLENSAEAAVAICRLPADTMRALESKLRNLEHFLRVRRDERKGLYGYVASMGDFSGGILYGRTVGSAKRQRPLYSSAELVAMEVRAMECLRRLLRRSSEALYLLQLVSQHNITRLVQQLDPASRQKLIQLTFHQLVCSDEGDRTASKLISNLMEYYVGPERSSSLDDISTKLREGCPSYFNQAEHNFFMAVDKLERASLTNRPDERQKLAKDAFEVVKIIPDSVDLASLCKRFENLRFYEAVVRLPLQKAQNLESSPSSNPMAIEECYEIVTNALRNLQGSGVQGMDPASRIRYTRQVIQLSMEQSSTAFREHLYRTLINLGLENELLEFGGPDLVEFLQSGGTRRRPHETRPGGVYMMEAPVGPGPTKYLDLLAKFYVLKGQHREAAQVLLRLAEIPSTGSEGLTLEQRHQYLSNAVLQAKTANVSAGPTRNLTEEGFLGILEDKLTVLGLQMRIRDEFELMASRSRAVPGEQENVSSHGSLAIDAQDVSAKVKELSLNLKSINQMYNDYALPYKLWEVCLEILNFANNTGEMVGRVVMETWARLLDQCLSTGGVKEACAVLKRVGPKLYVGDGTCLPLDSICLHLEKAALERLTKGIELVGDEDVARALIAACGGAYEPVVAVYDKLLTNGAVVPSLNLKLRLLRSILVVLCEWASTLSGSTALTYSGAFWMDRTSVINQGVRDKIISLANRYMTEVRRLPLPQSQTETIFQGFHDLEEQLLSTTHPNF
ncbi:Nuclear pore complex protein Nup155 [Rhynchospora pubera]|uniref:Nuclear pore complex protein Nup155 n=1 Tax=Rhynchospora pubera TaxID=906938 RepID=A0AAV8HX27_9POAL|nr:Nuclear pore complex protein Nup155 [Rhynchospora pubera]